MPFAFPSHQGLIAPIWRRWPDAFDVPALCVGAAMPDVVDGFAAIGHGHFGQGIGHSLVGLVFFGIPAGLALWFLLHAAAHCLGFLSASGFWARVWNRGLAAFHKGIRPSAFPRGWRFILWSLGVGGFSHLCFDLISHGGFPWLMPWVPKLSIFPKWWYTAWTHIALPGYKDSYVIGPHFVVWISLSFLGIYMLLRPAFRPVVEDGTKEEQTESR